MKDFVDTQVHIGPGGAAELISAMDALGIASVLLDELWHGTPGHPFYAVGDGAIRTASPTAELASWTYPGRFSYLLRIDYRDPELRSVIHLARDAEHVRAIRVAVAASRADMAALAAGEFGRVFAAAADCGLPIFVLVPGNSDLLVPYLEKYRDIKVVLCHCGMPPGPLMRAILEDADREPDSSAYWTRIGDEPIDAAFEKVLRMADWPNVALKWAHAPMMFDHPGYPNEGTRPYLRRAVDAFGADRIMWASDISANLTGDTWAELLFAIRHNPDLSDEEKSLILGGAARRWLNWPKIGAADQDTAN